MKTTNQNPFIQLQDESLSDEARFYAARIIDRSGRLRGSKPKIEYTMVQKSAYSIVVEPTSPSGEIAYVWRMVAFQIGTRPADHCMPYTAEFSVPGSYDERKARVQELDAIVDAIVNTVPKREWHGVQRWAQVYGAANYR